MSTKHIFDSSDGLVLKALKGVTALNPDLRLHAPTKSVYSKSRSKNSRVALISGGGAGHEPAHAGYTGMGMLSASVAGDIFASPNASQILTCIRLALAAQETNQVLLIVNNYTGDRLNFGLAAERAHGLSFDLGSLSRLEKIGGDKVQVEVETVVVADDVSLLDRPSLVGPRGLAGNILVCKILGAAAEAGLNLSDLKKLGDAIVSNLASIGVGLAHCHVPGRNTSDDRGKIDDGMCELGLGLHNEPGVRLMDVGSAEKLVREMLEQILTSSERRARATGSTEPVGSFAQTGDAVVLYVNNLGGMSMLEMSAVVDETVAQLDSQGVHPARVLLSSYMTSLNAPGFSLSLLNLSSISQALLSLESSENSKESVTPTTILSFIDAPTEATAWTGVRTNWPVQGEKRNTESEQEEIAYLLRVVSPKSSVQVSEQQLPSKICTEDVRKVRSGWGDDGADINSKHVEAGIRGACAAVIEVEDELTYFDTIVGDGDCGATFSSGARAVLKALDEGELDAGTLMPAELMQVLSDVLLNAMGGTSGALFSLYFTALSNSLASHVPASSPTPSPTNTNSSIIAAPLTALQALSAYTPARPGDRTIIDALSPFCTALAACEGLSNAVKGARNGAESTRGMHPRLGRATYVGQQASEDEDSSSSLPPDPGAWGIAALLDGLVQGLTLSNKQSNRSID